MSNVSNLSLVCMQFIGNLEEQALVSIPNRESPAAWEVWLFGLVFVTAISLSAAIGIVLLPLLTVRTYTRTLTYFVGLGVGSLSGSAVFHLLPEAFELTDDQSHEYISKSSMVIGGIYFFFFVDRLLRFIMKYREQRNADNEFECAKENSSRTIASVATVVCDTEEGAMISINIISKALPMLVIVQRFQRLETSASQRPSEKTSPIASVAWMIIFGDGLHNFIDGLSIGASFIDSLLGGISVSVAVLCEEFPHELGDVAILINSGMSFRQALLYNLASASTCFLGFIMGVLLGDIDKRIGQYIFALAGGMFLYISLSSMVAEMNKQYNEQTRRSVKKGLITMTLQVAGLATGLVVMFVMSKYGGQIQF